MKKIIYTVTLFIALFLLGTYAERAAQGKKVAADSWIVVTLLAIDGTYRLFSKHK